MPLQTSPLQNIFRNKLFQGRTAALPQRRRSERVAGGVVWGDGLDDHQSHRERSGVPFDP